MTRTSEPARDVRASGKPPTWPALLMGLGFGGFIDGILLHQILQWHHMVSDTQSSPMTTLEGLEANTLADGFFHVTAWLFVLLGTTGLIAAWRQGERAPSWRFHVGLLLAGWGIFNLVEGIIDHHLLGVHHVRDDLGGPPAWDIGFLVLGAALVVGGWMLHRSGEKAVSRDM